MVAYESDIPQPYKFHEVRKPKPKPVVKEVPFYGRVNRWQTEGFNPFPLGVFKTNGDTHKITFNIVEGVPDCNSIRMEKL